jgi:hypothetical protein
MRHRTEAAIGWTEEQLLDHLLRLLAECEEEEPSCPLCQELKQRIELLRAVAA